MSKRHLSILLALALTLLSVTAMAQAGGEAAGAPGGGAPGGGAPGGGAPGGAPGGGAPDPEALLAQAEKLYESLEYESALKMLIAVHQVKGVTPMQKARSFLYMGVCFTALGNAENAVQSFMELLKLKPSFRLPPGISPSIQAMFKEALTRLKMPETPPPDADKQAGGGKPDGEVPVAVEAKAPGKAPAGQAVDIKIEIKDPQGLVEDVVIQWRRVGGPDYSMIRVKYKPGQKAVTGRIPGAVVGTKAGKLHYLVELLGKGGMSLAHAGTMNEPLALQLTEPKQKKSKWGWYALGIGGGLVVVGGVVAAILLTRGSGPKPAPSTELTVTIK